MEDFGGYTQNGQGNPYITGDPTANFTHHPQSHPIPQPDLTPGAAFFHSLDQTQQQRQPSQQFVHPSFEQNGFYAIAPQTYFSHPDSMSANNHQMGLAMQYPQMQQLFPFASISSATPESYLQQPMDFQYGSRLPNQYAGPVRLSLDPQSQHNQPQSQFEIYQPEVKARANITDEHRKFLELKFAETPYPSSEEKAAIGAQIGLQSDVITRWYERQRKVLGIRKDKLLQNSSLSTLQISALPTQEIVNKRSRSQADDSDDILSPQMHQGIAKVLPFGSLPLIRKTPEEVIKSSSLLKETLVHCVSRTSSYNSKEGIRFVFEVMKIATTDAQKLIILHGIRDNAKKEPLQLSVGALRVVLIYSLSETQILARMRNWFTSAIKEKSLQMLVACLEVFKKMPLTSEALANVKLAKPILLALKKYPESSAVGALSKHLIPLAQKATSESSAS
ncbi:Cleavage and polyadenylation factor complex subunit [Neolecta irregularis DAH-3]|uniref:Cleavage and polyadenylation factor complex subunit n=1 Tax=Neolecta irregularis (strain DAH-3) TaxID=1198029 RepID=A0A1U7LR05_NEOID|nr:Cleavage and polyadenylation factor complex subunit [Neolecta irregularis DAH-3]|eukprot:OLL25074.1 Cleavage and polyadenylation factor complex subunit [Neolecta irregularis DAH-3]